MTVEKMRDLFERGILRIEWDQAGAELKPRGYMDINMQKFFPAKQRDISKLHKAILKMYWSWWDSSSDPDPVWPRVREWMVQEIRDIEPQIRNAASGYVSAMTDMREQEQVVKDKKYADGRPVPMGMLKEEKFLLQDSKRIVRDYKQQYDALTRRKKKLEENIRFISNWQE